MVTDIQTGEKSKPIKFNNRVRGPKELIYYYSTPNPLNGKMPCTGMCPDRMESMIHSIYRNLTIQKQEQANIILSEIGRPTLPF